MRGLGRTLSRLIVQFFSRPETTALQLKRRAEWVILCSPLFICPLLMFHDNLSWKLKIVLQACWAFSLFIGYVLYAEHKKRSR